MVLEVTVAKSAGFCFGVKRAVDTVYRQVEEGNTPVYTFGPIIHNEQVVKDLEEKGVQVISSEEELDHLLSGTVVIRSHGVPRAVCDKIKEKGLILVDATCPFVKKIHRIVEEESRKGKHIVIIGSEEHPEVQGIKGWAVGPVTVIKTAGEAEEFIPEDGKSVCIVAQTTFNYNKFKDLVEIFSKKSYDSSVLKTICNATEERQTEARAIARKVDAMFVVGGRHSSNTQKLYEICKEECKNTYFIETLVDLKSKPFQSFGRVGITAGASTPNKIIEEVQKMSELSFEQMLDESFKTIRNGEVVEGTVIDVKDDQIILNIGYKADGILTKSEYTNDASVDLHTVAQPGDKMEVKVLKVNDGEGQVLLTYKRLAAEKGNKRLEEAFENHEVLKAKVTQVLNGGLSVVIDEARIFIPASLVSDVYEKDLSKYADQEIEFVITEFNPRRRRIIGDRKQLIVEQKKKMQEELFARISAGDTVEGVVKNVTDFGAFIDLGGADGLLHISEMSWGRVENPKKVFKVGEQVKVLIKDINGDKIALSLKFPEENPWLNAADKYAAGNVVEGRVARMTDFGAFVELEPGVDALLHVSQISREHVEKPSDALKIGQVITAKVVDFNEEEKKISLSMKVLENEAPAQDAEAPVEE
ncbi:MAG: bifunctional 4-hydroxy-3-methylbut-2-enyl diphosphate reductase/30S ribosomal protein S1 [Lachnospiraceae bacterium]|nr:bifunctional 4-hydroxy-3-methylbut-2-enyl diphosphate reductase/30S ribosomal protein S1 [Lachnospiraceae bacterium]